MSKEIKNNKNTEIKEVIEIKNDDKLQAFLLSLFQKNDIRKDKKGNLICQKIVKDGVITYFCDFDSKDNNGFKVSSATHKKNNVESSLLTSLDIQEILINNNVAVIPKTLGIGTNLVCKLISKDSIIRVNFDTKEVSNEFNYNAISNFYSVLKFMYGFEKSEKVSLNFKTRKNDYNLVISKTMDSKILRVKINDKIIENNDNLSNDKFYDFLESQGIESSLVDYLYSQLS